MSSPGCSTLQEYNSTYNRYYNKCSANALPIAVRCYIKGLAPKYLKYVEMTDDIYTSLPKLGRRQPRPQRNMICCN